MYAQSLIRLAAKVDESSFFEEPPEAEAKERTNSCHDGASLSQFEPLEIGSDLSLRNAAQLCCPSKSGENSPKSSAKPLRDQQPYAQPPARSKLLQVINVEADEESSCKRELKNLTEQEALLFLKLVKNPRLVERVTNTDDATP